MALFGALFLALLAGAHAEFPGCKIRVTSKALELVKQEGLRFLEQELETITIPDLRGKEGHFYYNISEKVYDFLSTFITSGMRFLLNQQICPVLYHVGTVLLNALLDTVPVRSSVDELVGIDYSLMKDPVASTSNLDMDFRGAFFPLTERNWSLPNRAVEPQLQEEERMVYVAFSEFFFDSAMESYFRAGALQLSLVGDKVPHDLDMLLRATYFGSIVLLSPAVIDSPLKLELRVLAPPRCTIKPSGTTISVTASVTIALVPPDKPEVQLSSMTMDARLSAKMALRGKALRTQLDLRRFRIYSNHSALESLALIPLQAPLKTMLQIGVMPMLNERTWRGVQIPLPEGINFVREVVTNHAGFLTIGADLHFAKGLREVIEKNRPADVGVSTAPPPSTAAV
ncbi:PREDICTED: phospholipid transfer protein isoform X5 [Colobus angolensis palliatus]|uniref:Lipid-binding serum glycoprotein C-terminal domain-containing protein n=1 Tax=Colobus angolensis palliatus TaxID=336983 RepID=A0A2K5KH13_COLAP|nr:PREDICTED: phospholipid transfer protein isoform X5 [Colobus angolensis palliatus]